MGSLGGPPAPKYPVLRVTNVATLGGGGVGSK